MRKSPEPRRSRSSDRARPSRVSTPRILTSQGGPGTENERAAATGVAHERGEGIQPARDGASSSAIRRPPSPCWRTSGRPRRPCGRARSGSAARSRTPGSASPTVISRAASSCSTRSSATSSATPARSCSGRRGRTSPTPMIWPASVEQYRRLCGGEPRGSRWRSATSARMARSVWIELAVSLRRDAAGTPAYVIAIVQDISERKRLEEELSGPTPGWSWRCAARTSGSGKSTCRTASSRTAVILRRGLLATSSSTFDFPWCIPMTGSGSNAPRSLLSGETREYIRVSDPAQGWLVPLEARARPCRARRGGQTDSLHGQQRRHHRPQAGRGGAAGQRAAVPDVRGPCHRRVLPARRPGPRPGREPPGVREPGVHPGRVGGDDPARLRPRCHPRHGRGARPRAQRGRDGRVRVSPPAQGRDGLPGRGPGPRLLGGRPAIRRVPGPGHHRAQAGRGEASRESERRFRPAETPW